MDFKEKTGKSLDEWSKILTETKLEKHGQMVSFLKNDFGITHGFANSIVLKFREADAGSIDENELIKNQYLGKEQLKPIQEKLEHFIRNLGKDVEIAPKKLSISYRRKTQFALIQPTTKTRIDLGLKLKEVENKGKLESSGPFGTMCSHRIQLTDIEQVDEEVFQWLRLAYEKAG